MSEAQIMQEITRHEKAAQVYLLERNQWNTKRLYHRCRGQYMHLQRLWHLHSMSHTASPKLAEEYEIAIYLQFTVEQEHGRPVQCEWA